MHYEKAYAFLIHKLENELSPTLTYHNSDHTKAVIRCAELLAESEHIQGDELVLLKTAALFHDAGFLEQSAGHEELSCKFARAWLPDFGYDSGQVERICTIIMATKLPQTPMDRLGEILADAALFYLGREGYSQAAEKLYNEIRTSGAPLSEADWLVTQVDFLAGHKYFTRAANRQLNAGKQKILDGLRLKMETAIGHSHKEGGALFLGDMLLTLIGVTISGVALKLFLVPNHFFDGGVTGISLLVFEIYHFNLGLVILLLNLPLIIISYFSIGKRFAFRTLISVILLGICLLLIPNYAVTADKLLISIFGGAFLGIGVGLIMRTGAALDGIEVLAVYTLKKTSFTITEIILGINIIIFTIAGFRFGIETALYSILTYFTATRCIDYVVEGLQAFTGVTIVSGKSEVIKYQLVNKLGRGITVYKGERGFLPGKYEISSECDIIFTIITRLELRKLKNLVYEADPDAFVFANTIREASGGIIKRRQSH
jgi:uncharacterized membrane-anchored protein YitT (DUF2179 family)/predicted metal-dependent HD superfamily phosphohydrolase